MQALNKLLDMFKPSGASTKPKAELGEGSSSGESREERELLLKQVVTYWEANVRSHTQKAKNLSAFNVVQIATPNEDHTLLGMEASLKIRQAKVAVDAASEPVSVQTLYPTIVDAYIDFAGKDRIVTALDKGSPEVLIGVRLASDLILSVSMEEILSRMPLADVKAQFAITEVEAMLLDKFNLKPTEKIMVNVCAVGLHKIEREYFDEWTAVLAARNTAENSRVLYNVIGVAPHGTTFALSQMKKGDRVTVRNIRVIETISAEEWNARYQIKLQPASMYSYQNPTYQQPVHSTASNSSWREGRHIADEVVDYGLHSHSRKMHGHHGHHGEGSSKRRPQDDEHVQDQSRRRAVMGPYALPSAASHRIEGGAYGYEG